MAIAQTETLLSLDRFAQIMGINPVHFNGAYADAVFPAAGCGGAWLQHAWQDPAGSVSREEIAQALASAQWELDQILGYPVGPTWVVDEAHILYPGVYNIQATHPIRSLSTRSQSLVEAGLTVTYSDEDGDGYKETATIVCTLPAGAVASEIKPFFPGKDGATRYQIRSVTRRTLVGSVLTIVMPSWVLIEPDLWEQYPGYDGVQPIDAANVNNLVATLDAYRIYATSGNLTFSYANTVCNETTVTTADACARIVDAKLGLLAFDYPSAISAACVSGRPFTVRLSYLAGLYDPAYEDGVPHVWAEALAWLATARTGKPTCSCSSMVPIWHEMQRNLAERGDSGQNLSFLTIMNPLGTRGGEVRAWHKASTLADVQIGGVM